MRSPERRCARILGAALAATLLLAAPPAARAADALAEARTAAAAGDTAGALATLAAHLAAQPDDRQALFLRAQLLAWSGEYAASREAYGALLAAEPGHADYLFGRAQASLWDGDAEAALADVLAARAAAPDYAALDELERQARDRLAAAGSPAGRAAPNRRRAVLAEAGWERLDRGYDDWSLLALRAHGDVSANVEARGSLARMGRFGTSDVEATAGLSWQAAPRFGIGADLALVADADFLPRWSGQLLALARLGDSTHLQGGYRHSRYPGTRSDTLWLTLERYLACCRLAYSVYRGDPADASTTYTHVLRADFYYDERSYAGLQLTTGRESESDGAGGLLVSDVEGAALVGRHQLSPRWALAWALTWHEQGDLYRRAGFNVGLARSF